MSDKSISGCEQRDGDNTGLAMASQFLSFLDELEQSWPHLRWRLGFSGPGVESGPHIRIQEGAGYVIHMDCVTDCWSCSKVHTQMFRILARLYEEEKKG